MHTRFVDDQRRIRYTAQGFNAEFENIVNRHTTYTVPDEALKQRLQQITTELVVPEYKAFRQRCVMSTANSWHETINPFTEQQKYLRTA
jgi:hypothetical protein